MCITHDAKSFAAPKHRIRREWYCYLFIFISGVPDLSDNVKKKKLYLVPQYLLIFILFKLCDFFPLFYIKVSLQTFLFICVNKRSSFHNCLFLILN